MVIKVGVEFYDRTVCGTSPLSPRFVMSLMLAGAKAHSFRWFIGTTEVVPCYKTFRFESFREL